MKKYLLIASLYVFGLSSVVANPAHQRILELNENKRQQVLSSYMQQNGEQCAVVRTFYQGATKAGDVFWNVECGNGEAFGIMIKNDANGSTMIMECDVLKQVGAGECFKKFK